MAKERNMAPRKTTTIERPPLRPEARPEFRDADARAREIMEHGGVTHAEYTDEFYVPTEAIPPGWTYEWKRRTVYNAEDPSYTIELQKGGWEPVPAERHPEMMPHGYRGGIIERKGLVLMERPKQVTDYVRSLEQKKATQQVRAKEEQLTQAPAGQFERNNKDNSMLKLKKSLSPVEIPKDDE
jgi:hypothetical protein